MAAPNPASAGEATLDTTGGIIFSGQGGPCAVFGVTNRDSTNDLLVAVNGIHVAGDFRHIAPGASYSFGSGSQITNGITTVFAKAAASTVVCDWSVDARR